MWTFVKGQCTSVKTYNPSNTTYHEQHMPSSTLQPLQLYNKYAHWGEVLKQSPVLLVPSLSDKRTTVRSLFSNCQSHIFYLNSPSFRELHSTFYLQMNSVWYRRWMKLKRLMDCSKLIRL